MQVQVVIELTEGRSSLLINQLAREDARPDERAFAQAIEDLLLSVNHFASEQAGVTVTEERIGPVPAETAEEAEARRLRGIVADAHAVLSAHGVAGGATPLAERIGAVLDVAGRCIKELDGYGKPRPTSPSVETVLSALRAALETQP